MMNRLFQNDEGDFDEDKFAAVFNDNDMGSSFLFNGDELSFEPLNPEKQREEPLSLSEFDCLTPESVSNPLAAVVMQDAMEVVDVVATAEVANVLEMADTIEKKAIDAIDLNVPEEEFESNANKHTRKSSRIPKRKRLDDSDYDYSDHDYIDTSAPAKKKMKNDKEKKPERNAKSQVKYRIDKDKVEKLEVEVETLRNVNAQLEVNVYNLQNDSLSMQVDISALEWKIGLLEAEKNHLENSLKTKSECLELALASQQQQNAVDVIKLATDYGKLTADITTLKQELSLVTNKKNLLEINELQLKDIVLKQKKEMEARELAHKGIVSSLVSKIQRNQKAAQNTTETLDLATRNKQLEDKLKHYRDRYGDIKVNKKSYSLNSRYSAYESTFVLMPPATSVRDTASSEVVNIEDEKNSMNNNI